MSAILAIIVAFITLFVPGELLALALLRKTKLNLVDISIIGFVFGLVATPTMTWVEAYLIPYMHFFTFSLGLFEANALVLTIIGIILCFWQGVFSFSKLQELAKPKVKDKSLYQQSIEEVRSRLDSYEKGKNLVENHKAEESESLRHYEDSLEKLEGEQKADFEKEFKERNSAMLLDHKQEEIAMLEKLTSQKTSDKESNTANLMDKIKIHWVYEILILLIIASFLIGMESEVIAPIFFQFDPYYYMIGTEALLTYGYQPQYTYFAWPTISKGVITRAQPLLPYLEAYWYSLANYLGPHYTALNNTLMSYTSSFYPPIVGAILVFVIFMMLYNEYGKYIALIGASLVATMPVLVTEFTAGQQLTEPWGIFSLFFFFMAYLLAVKDKNNVRLAIFAGVAFAFTFLGAHYYTVDMGVLAVYIIFEGIIDLVARNGIPKGFYKMNIIVLLTIAVFLAAYTPYHATFSVNVPKILGIPLTVSGPALALLLVAVLDYGPKMLNKYNIMFKNIDRTAYIEWIVGIAIIVLIATAFTPIGKPIIKVLDISKKFTSPSSALFMTVAEYEPSGLFYNFGAAGFGLIGSSILGIPIMVWLVSVLSILLIFVSIIYRRSETGIFYLAVAVPLMYVGFIEVEYLPHFGIAFILLFCIMLGELLYLIASKFKPEMEINISNLSDIFKENKTYVYSILLIGLFFVSTILAIIALLVLIFKYSYKNKAMYSLLALFLIVVIAGSLLKGSLLQGESSSLTSAIASQAYYSAGNTTAACNNEIGADFFCNTIPNYWISFGKWLTANVGPNAPRVLSWWDYGDWINFFGHSNAVIRGDNANATEDEAVAASYVLGPKYGFNASEMANMMNTNQTAYAIFDQGLISKWGALDFLGCVYVNATSEAYAKAAAAGTNQPYVLGTSPCELEHDPEYVLVPYVILDPYYSTGPSLSDYCSFSTSSNQFARTYIITNDSISSQYECMSEVPNSNGAVQLYTSNDTPTNAFLNLQDYIGIQYLNISGVKTPFEEYMAIYTPNGPNGTITDAPTQFYNSNFYKGFFLGKLQGFHQVYSYVNDTNGTNLVNYTDPLRAFELNNFTGKLPPQVPKPPYVHNNYTMP